MNCEFIVMGDLDYDWQMIHLRRVRVGMRRNDNRFRDAIGETESDDELKTGEEFAASLHRMLLLYF